MDAITEYLNQREISNPEAEMYVINTIINHPEDRDENDIGAAIDALSRRDFSDPVYAKMFEVIKGMRRKRLRIDLLTINEESGSTLNEYMGRAEALHRDVLPFQIGQYVKILKNATAKRDFRTLGDKIQRAVYDDDFDAAQLTERIRMYLKEMATVSGEVTEIKDELAALYDAIFEKPEEDAGIRTGIKGLDELLDGLRPGRMYVIGARPGTGKTVFGVNAALRCAIGKKTVLYINREMEKTDLIKRQIASMTNIRMDELKGGVLPEAKWEEAMDSISALSVMPIHISNQTRTPAEIRQKAVEIYEKQGLGLIVIDYLQRLRPDGKSRSRDEEVGQMSNAIKDIALDLKVPVILLSQLNRDEQNRRPSMSRLRESGNIEQDADVVVLLHEPCEEDVPKGRQEQRRGIYQQGGTYLEMIVDKNRHGKTGIVPAAFYGAHMRYAGI